LGSSRNTVLAAGQAATRDPIIFSDIYDSSQPLGISSGPEPCGWDWRKPSVRRDDKSVGSNLDPIASGAASRPDLRQ
jgi:hypothetical protein